MEKFEMRTEVAGRNVDVLSLSAFGARSYGHGE